MDAKIAKPARTLGERITITVLLLFIATAGISILFPTGHHGARENARRTACALNLRQIMLGVRQYMKDYDEQFPPVATSPANFGWADAVQPYFRKPQLYQCPVENNGPQSSSDPTQPQYTDYWFNARLSRLQQNQLSAPSKTIALGEGNDGTDATNARYHLLSIPQKWRSDDQSPLYRHLEAANFAFADGHVKSIPARRWENELDTNDNWTLRLNPKK